MRILGSVVFTAVLLGGGYVYGAGEGEPLTQKDAQGATMEHTEKYHRYVLILGGSYGTLYPAGSVYASDGEVKREKGKYFGHVADVGYEITGFLVIHAGFTLWWGNFALTRHLLGQDSHTRYAINNCALNAGIMFTYKWFFSDVVFYTELPWAHETEEVYLAGEYVRTMTLDGRYDCGGFLGMGVRIPVKEYLSILAGIYGGGSFVPGMETSRRDELYFVSGALRMYAVFHLPD